jgi:regulator of protease activity HflC (stomatin/prohibitin superfamily)
MSGRLRHVLVCATAVALGALASGCMRSTGSTEIGIKVGKVFGADAVVTPGTTVIIIPFFHDWFVYDSKTQALEMRSSTDSASRRRDADGDTDDDLEFKTRDGNDISVDVTVLYHVDPQQAPTVLRRVARSMVEVQSLVVRPIARSVPRDSLNELSSEEFYDSDLRAAKEAQALNRLAEELAPFGIVCERVVLGNYRFHTKYQDAIDAKKVADQAVNKNRSAAEAAVKEWERDLEKTKGEVGQRIAAERGKAQQKRLQADAYFEAKKLEADAIISEKTANAEGIQKLKEAMAGSGGRTMVKLRVAEALRGKRIVLFPTSDGALNLQRTDINEWLKTIGIDALARESGTPAPPPVSSAPSGGR